MYSYHYILCLGGEHVRPDNRISWWIPVLAVLVVLAAVAAVLLLMPREEPAPDPSPPGTTGPTVPNALESLQFSRYSGQYVEDGTDEEVSNVAAILVNNPTSEFLDLGTVTYKVGGTTATFEITGLPPGGTAWVLEAERLQLEDGWEFEFQDSTYTFRADAIRQTDLLTVQSQDDTLTVTNVSDQTLENVCLYYKVKHSDGNYLGGITYMMEFGTLEPGASAQKRSAHYGPNAEIVRYSYQTG